MRTQHNAGAFIKPLWSSTDLAHTRPSAVQAPAKHLHAVGGLFEFLAAWHGHMHRLPIPRTAQMCEAGARNQTASGFFGMINCWQDLPIGSSVINGVVVQYLRRRSLIG